MNFDEAYCKLEQAGKEQNRKIYQRHGAKEPLFGVSFKQLGELRKKIKIDHQLALQLWASQNCDARILALMVADPQKMTLKLSEQWLSDIDYYMQSNYLGGLVAKTPFGWEAFKKWSQSEKEYFKHCGYDVLSTMLKHGYSLGTEELSSIMARIEKEIHHSSNRAKNAMNITLISIGVYCKHMRSEAVKTAKRIGKVEVDHRDTSCKTFDAVAYIYKAVAHHEKRASGSIK